MYVMCMCVCVRHYRNSAGQSLQCIHFWGCIIHTMLIVVAAFVCVATFARPDSLACRGPCLADNAERGGRERGEVGSAGR